MLDVSEVEGCGVGDDLDEVGIVQIRIVERDGSAVLDVDGLGIAAAAEVGVALTSIAGEPAGVDIEVQKVGQAARVGGASGEGLGALQDAELFEVDGVGAFGDKVSVEKLGVAVFVERVAGDVLRAVAIELREGVLIGVQWLIGSDLDGRLIADAAELCVLVPEIRFEGLGQGEELQNRDVSFGEAAALGECGCGFAEESGAQSSCASCQQSALDQRAAIDWTPGDVG